MSKFYSKYGRFGRDENSNPNLPEYVKNDNREEALQHISDSLRGANPEIAEYLCSNTVLGFYTYLHWYESIGKL